jgi:hypothetical protein
VKLCFCISGDDVDTSNSNDENVDTGQGSSVVARTKKRKILQRTSCRTLAAPPQPSPTTPALGFSSTWATDTGTLLAGPYPNWPWMPPQQLQSAPVPWMMPSGAGSMPSQVPWMMPSAPGSMPYLGLCWPPNAHIEGPPERTENNESIARAARRQKRKVDDEVATERSSVGRKPRQIRVHAGGEIDGACPGKNGWDDAIRGLVPWILDLSIVDWEAQKPEAVQKLHDHLDVEFEYVGNPLSM